MVKLKLKKVGILKLGYFGGIYGFIFGFIFGLIMKIVYSFLGTTFNSAGGIVLDYGWFSLILYPLIYGIGGLIGGIITALIINLILILIRGLEFHLEEFEESEEIPSQQNIQNSLSPELQKKTIVPTAP